MTDPGDLRVGDLMTVEEGQIPCDRVQALGTSRGRVLVHRADLEAFVQRARQAAPRAPTAPDVDQLLRRVRARRRGIGPPNGETG
jgi:hypothetical protein